MGMFDKLFNKAPGSSLVSSPEKPNASEAAPRAVGNASQEILDKKAAQTLRFEKNVEALRADADAIGGEEKIKEKLLKKGWALPVILGIITVIYGQYGHTEPGDTVSPVLGIAGTVSIVAGIAIALLTGNNESEKKPQNFEMQQA